MEEVDGATGYIVYRSTDKSKVDTQIMDITNGAVSYVDTALTAGNTYYYKVQPYCVVNGKRFMAMHPVSFPENRFRQQQN